MQITKGFKYRIYPNKEQRKLLDHQCFIYNQAYNICLNLQKEQWEQNKLLDKKDRTYLKASQIDSKVKLALKQRELSFKSVVAQQARINASRALEQALKDKTKAFLDLKIPNYLSKALTGTIKAIKLKRVIILNLKSLDFSTLL